MIVFFALFNCCLAFLSLLMKQKKKKEQVYCLTNFQKKLTELFSLTFCCEKLQRQAKNNNKKPFCLVNMSLFLFCWASLQKKLASCQKDIVLGILLKFTSQHILTKKKQTVFKQIVWENCSTSADQIFVTVQKVKKTDWLNTLIVKQNDKKLTDLWQTQRFVGSCAFLDHTIDEFQLLTFTTLSE